MIDAADFPSIEGVEKASPLSAFPETTAADAANAANAATTHLDVRRRALTEITTYLPTAGSIALGVLEEIHELCR